MTLSRRQLLLGKLFDAGRSASEPAQDVPDAGAVHWQDPENTVLPARSAEDILRRARRAPANEHLPWKLDTEETGDE